MFQRQSIITTNRILKEIAVLECENATILYTRSLRSLAYS